MQTTLHGLMGHTQLRANCGRGWLGAIGQQYARPLHPARRLRPRSGDRLKLGLFVWCDRYLDDPPPRRHARHHHYDDSAYTAHRDHGNPSHWAGIKESVY
jgi:hypothetical protein